MTVVDTSEQDLREELRTAAREMLGANSTSAHVRALAETTTVSMTRCGSSSRCWDGSGIEVSEDLGGAGGRSVTSQ